MPLHTNLLQRGCGYGPHAVADKLCDDCDRKDLLVQRKATGRAGLWPAPPIVHQVLRSPGRPLDPDTRASMESRFGHDFSRVRVHTDTRASESAHEVSAHAYTIENEIVFHEGHYSPGIDDGRRLLAHELTHVIQQNQSRDILLQRKSSPQTDKIRSYLTRGLKHLRISNNDVHEVLEILSNLNDQDLRDTLSDLGEDLTGRIFTEAGDRDLEVHAATLDRIRRNRGGRSLLMHIPEALVCERPPKGPFEMARSFKSMDDLVETIKKVSSSVSPPEGPIYFSKLGILAHGDMAGVFRIGSTIVNNKNLESFKTNFESIASCLTTAAIVYIFGCISGSGDDGSEFLQKLSILMPGRKIVGFNKITIISEAQAKVPGEMCYWPDIRATDITSELFRNMIKERIPATEDAPQAKVAQSGQIIKLPADEIPIVPEPKPKEEKSKPGKKQKGIRQPQRKSLL